MSCSTTTVVKYKRGRTNAQKNNVPLRSEDEKKGKTNEYFIVSKSLRITRDRLRIPSHIYRFLHGFSLTVVNRLSPELRAGFDGRSLYYYSYIYISIRGGLPQDLFRHLCLHTCNGISKNVK